MIKCNKCGAEVMDGAVFCTECGAELVNPFESGTGAASTNPFAAMEANVPKPESASTLVFGDEQPAKPSQQAQVQPEPAKPEPAKPEGKTSIFGAFAEGASGKPAGSSAQTEQAASAGAASSAAAAGAAAGMSDGGPTYTNPNQQGAWSDADQQAQQGNYNPGAQQTQNSAGAGWDQRTDQAQQNQQYTSNNWDQQSIYSSDYELQPQGSDKLWSVLSYLSILFWVIAYFLGAKNNQRSPFFKHHLNQALIINLVSMFGSLLGTQSTIGWFIRLFTLVFSIWGMVRAGQGSTRPLPVVGNYKLLK